MLKFNYLQRFSRVLRPATHITKINTYVDCFIDSVPIVNESKHQFQLSNNNKYFGLEIHRQLHLSSTSLKYNKKTSRDESDSEDENDPEFKDERDSKVVKTKVNSLRTDLLLRAGLNLARNKIETIFYESKIRVNGKKLQKKSIQLNVGDEIDVIRGFSQVNPSHLVIARVVLLATNEREDSISVNMRRYKSLLVENYAGANAYKSSETTEH